MMEIQTVTKAKQVKSCTKISYFENIIDNYVMF